MVSAAVVTKSIIDTGYKSACDYNQNLTKIQSMDLIKTW